MELNGWKELAWNTSHHWFLMRSPHNNSIQICKDLIVRVVNVELRTPLRCGNNNQAFLKTSKRDGD